MCFYCYIFKLKIVASNDTKINQQLIVKYFGYFIYDCREGANVMGAYAWSLIDGFEFNLGMGIRVGLYYVDKELNRHPRKSAQWFKEMLAQNNTALA